MTLLVRLASASPFVRPRHGDECAESARGSTKRTRGFYFYYFPWRVREGEPWLDEEENNNFFMMFCDSSSFLHLFPSSLQLFCVSVCLREVQKLRSLRRVWFKAFNFGEADNSWGVDSWQIRAVTTFAIDVDNKRDCIEINYWSLPFSWASFGVCGWMRGRKPIAKAYSPFMREKRIPSEYIAEQWIDWIFVRYFFAFMNDFRLTNWILLRIHSSGLQRKYILKRMMNGDGRWKIYRFLHYAEAFLVSQL